VSAEPIRPSHGRREKTRQKIAAKTSNEASTLRN
jgi:hypothetical protein